MRTDELEGSPKKGADVLDKSTGTKKKVPKATESSRTGCLEQSINLREEASKENCKFCQLEEKKKEVGGKRRLWVETVQHYGPNFIPPYRKLPEDIKFVYDGVEMVLSLPAEEVARFYAELLDDDCITEEVFRNNFFHDWRNIMTEQERLKITSLDKCNFTGLKEYSKVESKRIVAQLKLEKESKYGFCKIDGVRHRIYNCNVEFPGLFQGELGNSKNGKVKRRIVPKDVTVNCSSEAAAPEPPTGHAWGGFVTKPTVSWLWEWREPVGKKIKHMRLHDSSPLKGNVENDKYETARHLHVHINAIRKGYKADWKSTNRAIQERGVALYIIDQSALRIGNEKYKDSAGCCTLHIKDINLRHESDSYLLKLNFTEKGSKRYTSELKIKQKPYELLENFIQGRDGDEYVFAHLTAADLNKHVATLMTGLTVKVFRTYTACLTFQKKLDEITEMKVSPTNKLALYKQAAMDVAKLCNHQRTVRKSTELDALTEQFEGLAMRTDSSTIKCDYLDPRITIAWCNDKRNSIPLEAVLGKELRKKFQWAIDTTEANYRFDNIGQAKGKKKKLFEEVGVEDGNFSE